MPKDQRLYMTFPNDFWMHPKVALLSVGAKWTFVEMNGYSRMQDLDGTIPAALAHRMWEPKLLTELAESHPERPLVVYESESDTYVIRDYAQHQQTKTARETVSQARSAAGSAGRQKQLQANESGAVGQTLGKSPGKTRANAGQKPGQIRAEIEIETETEIEKRTTAPRSRAVQISRDFTITDAMREWARTDVPLVDVDQRLPAWIDYWVGVGKPQKDWVAVWRNGMRKQQEFAERDRPKKRSTDDWMNR